MTKGIEITRVTWDDVKARRAADEGAEDGLLRAAAVILEMANQDVPYETGRLAGSGAVDFDKGSKIASVFYDTVYAARLHQNPKFNFQNGRRGKWLRRATIASKPHVLEFFGDALRLRFSGRRRA